MVSENRVIHEDMFMRVEETPCERKDVEKMFHFVEKDEEFARILFKGLFDYKSEYDEFKVTPRILFLRKGTNVYWLELGEDIKCQFERDGSMSSYDD